MKKILVALVALSIALPAMAETDYISMPVISDIQRGVDNANQIDTLRVSGDGDIGGDLVVVGTVTSSGASGVGSALTVTASGTSTAIIIGADAAGAANTQLDTTGAGAITIGSADVTAITLTTDATGDGTDVVLPTGSIGSAEILDATVAPADVAEGIVVSPTGYAGSGVKIQFGSVTNWQTITFADAFSATPAVTLGAEGVTTPGSNVWYVTGLTSAGFTAFTQPGVAGGYIAVGLK